MGIETIKLITPLAKPLTSFGVAKFKKLEAIHQFRIEQALENSLAEVWTSIGAYLTMEGISDTKKHIMAQACVEELKPFAKNPQYLIDNSLDGEKLFEHLRKEKPFPQAVRDEGLEMAYQLIFPLVASVLCRSTVIVEQLKDLEFAEVLSRFDFMTQQLGIVVSGIKQIQQRPTQKADHLYNRVLQQSLKKVLLGVEVTGLYGDSSVKNAKEEMFILPEIKERRTEGKSEKMRGDDESRLASNSDQHIGFFLGYRSRSIIRGAPGSGKSTWSKWIQAQSIRNSNILVLYLKLRSYADKELPRIIDLIHEIVGQNMAQEIVADSVTKWIQSGKIGLIIDGFDEVAPDNRPIVLAQVQELADYLENGPCILTSRPLNSDHLNGSTPLWSEWTILPFDESRIVEYISRWYKHAPLKEGSTRDVDASALYRDLTKDPHIAPLTGNPLMLATLLMVHHNDGELPKGRSRLYARYIDGMLGIWDDRQEVKVDTTGLEREQKKRILTSLAISLHLDNIDELSEARTLEVIHNAISEYNYKSDGQLVLDSLRERSGLIIGPGSYSFTHKSVGEYLVSQAICDGDRDFNGEKLDRYQLYRERNNDRWLNVLYFWAGSAPVGDVQAFIGGMNPLDSCGLILGLAWDQMDRFKKDWLRPQVLRCLNFLADDFDYSRSEYNYYGWNFSDDFPMLDKKIMRGGYPPIKHISISDFETGPTFKDLLARIDFGFEDLNELSRQIPLYNACAGSFLEPPGREDYFKNLSKIDEWPTWLKKAQSACICLAEVLLEHKPDLTLNWRDYWKDEDNAAAWLGAALAIASRSRWGTGSWVPQNVFSALKQILDSNWSDAALIASANWHEVETVPVSGTSIVKRDLLDEFATMLIRLHKELASEQHDIPAVERSLKKLVIKRNELKGGELF